MEASSHQAVSVELRFTEIELKGRTVTGTALSYSDRAKMPWGEERVEPGAFGDLSEADLTVNMMHDKFPLSRTNGGLLVSDNGKEIRISAEIVDTQKGNDAITMIRSNILRGISMEFRAIRDRFEGNLRIIQEGVLFGFGLVDRPAYPKSLIESRRAAIEQATNTNSHPAIRGTKRRRMWPSL